jgi:hypothetical protein
MWRRRRGLFNGAAAVIADCRSRVGMMGLMKAGGKLVRLTEEGEQLTKSSIRLRVSTLIAPHQTSGSSVLQQR